MRARADHRWEGVRRPLAGRAPPRAAATRWWPSTSRPTSPTRPPSSPWWPTAAPDAIYHLAALTHVGESWEVPAEVLRVNVLGTAAVLAAARRLADAADRAGGQLGRGLRHRRRRATCPLTEASPVAPVTPYAASKAAAEQVALQAWRGYGQPVVVVRPVQPRGAGAGPDLRRVRPGPAHRRGPPVGPVDPAGGHPHHPAGLHRRARRGARLPPRGRPGGAGLGLQRVLGPRRGDRPRSRRACWRWPGPTSSWSPTPRSCGRSTSRCCGATRPGSRRPRGGSPRSRSTTPWPTSSPTGSRAGGGLTGRQAGQVWRRRSRAVRAVWRADTARGPGRGPASWPPRLAGGGQLLLERLEGRLDEGEGALDDLVDAAARRRRARRAGLGQAVVEARVLASSVLELDPLHLGPLEPEDAEADDDVGGVAGEVGRPRWRDRSGRAVRASGSPRRSGPAVGPAGAFAVVRCKMYTLCVTVASTWAAVPAVRGPGGRSLPLVASRL